MNKKILSAMIILSSTFVLAGCTKQSPTSQTPNKSASENSEFAKAVQSGKPTICTMTKGDDTMEYMIKDKSMRINTTSVKKDESGKTTTVISHMINDTKYLYLWSDSTKQGSKIAIPTEEETKAMAEKAKEYQKNVPQAPKLESQADYDNLKNEGYTIDCKSGSVDDSVFVPPSDIKFIDPSTMMKAIPSPDANGKYDMSKLQELQKQYGGSAPADY